jgi:hypothetical protein
MGYIHTASLRWALQREGKLTFNANLRLFSSSRYTTVNAWYINMVVIFCAILTYAAPSLTFLQLGDTDVGNFTGNSTIVSRVAVVCLGIGIIGQAFISTFALFSTRIPTWSSSPIDTLKACLHIGALDHLPNRCMMGVKDAAKPSQSKCPTSSHPSMISSHNEVKWIFRLTWFLIPLCILWGLVVKYLADHLSNNNLAGGSWALMPQSTGDWASDDSPYVVLRLHQLVKNQYVAGILGIVLVTSLQAILTITLHCIELFVNLHRDEIFWRTATTSAKGCQNSSYNPISAACKSWATVSLFLGKAIIHSLFGLSITEYYERDTEWYKVESKLRPFFEISARTNILHDGRVGFDCHYVFVFCFQTIQGAAADDIRPPTDAGEFDRRLAGGWGYFLGT